MVSPQPATQPTPGLHSPPAQKSGCGPVAVFALSSLAFIVGIFAGVGVLAFLMSSNPDIAETLGIDLPTKEVVVEKVIEKNGGTTANSGGDYALVYPVEESLRIEGSLKKKEIIGVITDNRYNLRDCYVKGKKEDSNLKGEMFLQINVAKGSGKVQSAIARQTTFDNKTTSSCIMNEVKSWRFSDNQKSNTSIKVDLLLLPIAGP